MLEVITKYIVFNHERKISKKGTVLKEKMNAYCVSLTHIQADSTGASAVDQDQRVLDNRNPTSGWGIQQAKTWGNKNSKTRQESWDNAIKTS